MQQPAWAPSPIPSPPLAPLRPSGYGFSGILRPLCTRNAARAVVNPRRALMQGFDRALTYPNLPQPNLA